MTNQASRLIASAIIVAGGGTTLGLGLLVAATNSNFSGAEAVGSAMLFVSGIMFVLEYVRSLRADFQRRPRKARRGARGFEVVTSDEKVD